MEFPVPLLVSAGTYIDKYGPAEKYDVVTRIPDVTAPLFCVIGTAEPMEQFPFWGLPEEMAAASRRGGELHLLLRRRGRSLLQQPSQRGVGRHGGMATRPVTSG